jgi:molybdenum cofactor cytidylyltransferase
MNTDDQIFAVVLAGGTASRFGRLKQIEPAGGTCLLGIVVENAVRCDGIEKVILVLGHEADTVRGALGRVAQDEKLEIVVNRDYRKGLSTSLRAGLEKAREGGCDAAVFLLGDMPMIDTNVLDTVIARYREANCRICYVKTNGPAGHPIIARRNLFGEFMKVRGDIGGREVLRKNAQWSLAVELGSEGTDIQLDINDERDMERYLSRSREHHAS